jgi:hypothetical protein
MKRLRLFCSYAKGDVGRIGGVKMKQKCMFGALIIVFLILFILTLIMKDNTDLTKMNILTQLIYTFVTTVLVILTYGVLKATQQQKHQAVRPYLIATSFDIYKNAQENMREEIDFEVINEGPGIALNIKISVKRKNDGEVIFEEEYTRLNIQDSQIYGALCQIRDEINLYRNQGGNGMYYVPYTGNGIEVGIPIKDNFPDQISLIVEISYSDIYGKKYKTIFDAVLNKEDDETYQCTEQFIEL